MTQVTDEQLQEWQRLADEATPGPWENWTIEDDGNRQDEWSAVGPVHADMQGAVKDAAFIAAARTAVPALVAEVRMLRSDWLNAVAERNRERADAGEWAGLAGSHRIERDEARAEVERLTVKLGAASTQYHVMRDSYEPLCQERNALQAEVEQLRVALDEREGDMHIRIRAGYDKAVADAWREKVAEVERERDEARAEVERLREALETCAEIGETRVAVVVRKALGESDADR
jgi:hypothetical protein